jgi:hypothetical protein
MNIFSAGRTGDWRAWLARNWHGASQTGNGPPR